MTKEEYNAIEAIHGTVGFNVLKAIVEAKMKKLDSVMEIKREGLVAEQALGRQLAYETLREFLSEIKLINSPPKEERKTYE